MKQLFSDVGMGLFGLFVILLFSGVDCSDKKNKDNPPDLCGIEKGGSTAWSDDYTMDLSLSPELNYDGVSEGKARYSYSIDDIDDICAHNHVYGFFEVNLELEEWVEFDFDAEIMYGVLYTYPINEFEWITLVGLGSVTRRAEYNFGMKFLYGDLPGWAFPILTVSFNDQGSELSNDKFFRNHIIRIIINLKYYEWKDNTGGV